MPRARMEVTARPRLPPASSGEDGHEVQQNKGPFRGGAHGVPAPQPHFPMSLVCLYKSAQGFPGGPVVENLPANAGDTGSSPGLGRSHMPRSN